MLLGSALVLVGGAVLYYAVTGQDPRKLFAVAGSRSRGGVGVSRVTAPASRAIR